MSLVLAGRLPCVALLLVIAGGPTLVAEPRDSELCRALVEHAAQMRAVDATAVEKVRQRWDSRDAAFDAGQFVPEALALLDADFAAAYEAFKSGDFATSASAFATLGESGDPYVAVNALHFQARSLVECDQVETATRLLAEAVPRGPHLAEFSPFVPRLYLQYALCETLQGQVAPAAAVLRKLERDFPDAPVNAHADTAEMLAGLEHARFQPLSQVANLMTNVTARLRTAEAGDDVQDRQQRVVALLDELIEQSEKSEQQQQERQQQQTQQGAAAALQPNAPAAESTERAGQGEVGALDESAAANPGETWGQLPPQERERILQSLRQRYPARYRALVEQYYRSLSEEP